MADCVSMLNRITGGLNASEMAVGWLLENQHNANILAVAGSMFDLYDQLLGYQAAGCDFQELNKKLDQWTEQVDQQLAASESNSDLAKRMVACLKASRGATCSAKDDMSRASEVYSVGNCFMRNYPGYF